MPTRWNVDHQHALIDPLNYISVAPGASYEFTDEQIEAGIAGCWSEVDPREGLSDERAFKLARDSSRGDLDDQAHALGVDTTDLHTKQDVAQAIQAALDAAAQTIDTDPADTSAEGPDTSD